MDLCLDLQVVSQGTTDNLEGFGLVWAREVGFSTTVDEVAA